MAGTGTVIYAWMLGILLCCLPLFIDGVKITSLDVPKRAWGTTRLNCRYDLEGEEKLYAVKWYKDDYEFFRCSENGTVTDFTTSDLKIYFSKTSQIGSCYFDLVVTSNRSGGIYRCEVSLDWPTFREVKMDARLRVVEPSRIVPEYRQEDSSTEDESTESEVDWRSERVMSKGTPHLASFPNVCIPLLFIILSVIKY